eukprot:gene10628-3251_t
MSNTIETVKRKPLFLVFTVLVSAVMIIFTFIRITTEKRDVQFENFKNNQQPVHSTVLFNSKVEREPYEIRNQCRNYTIRNFNKDPVTFIIPSDQNFAFWIANKKDTVEADCDVRCIFTKKKEKYQYSSDGFVKLHIFPFKYKKKCKNQMDIHYTMEKDHPKGYDMYFATRTDADFYAPYSGYDFSLKPFYSWKEKKNMTSVASAYISNCQVTQYDRIATVKKLLNKGMKIDIFGGCFEKHLTSKEPKHLEKLPRDDRKVKNMARYFFHLSFENGFQKGYLTEKYWQALYSGVIPIVIGANDLHYFEPSSNSVIHWKDLNNVDEIVEKVNEIVSDENKYNEMMKWKETGPSDQFLSIVDQNCLLNFCHWCHKVADKSVPRRIYDEKNPNSNIFVREYGRFRYKPIELKEFTLDGLRNTILKKFEGYHPIWWKCGSKAFRKNMKDQPVLRIHRIVFSGLNFKDSLFSDPIDSDGKVSQFEKGVKLDVIFV